MGCPLYELVHLGTAINGQADAGLSGIASELMVQTVTTPENVILGSVVANGLLLE